MHVLGDGVVVARIEPDNTVHIGHYEGAPQLTSPTSRAETSQKSCGASTFAISASSGPSTPPLGVDHERVVLFFNVWRDADGYLVGPGDMAGLFCQACVRAGRTPTERGNFFVPTGWEVRPQICRREPPNTVRAMSSTIPAD